MITNHQREIKEIVQRYNVLKNRDLISSKVLSRSSKLLSFISLHRHHKRYHLPHNSTLSVASNLPKSIQIDYSSRHDPRQPKSTEVDILNGTSNLTIHRLPIPFKKTTAINHHDVPLLKIVYHKDPS